MHGSEVLFQTNELRIQCASDVPDMFQHQKVPEMFSISQCNLKALRAN